MSNADTKLREWHNTFGVPILDRPQSPPEDRRRLRVDLIREGFLEFCDASGLTELTPQRTYWGPGDVIEAADALADLVYVIYGAALEWGIPLDAVFDEVHRSNMTKVWPDGTVHYRDDGKVIKPPTYSPADVALILNCGIG